IIFDVIRQINLQFIIATHSPIFVNEKTIDGIRRFYLDDNGFTKVIIPDVGSKEKELIQILNYTNSSKIFFSDKVVLVEGDSDEYFFRFYFDKYKETRAISKSIDFLYIGGKDKIGYWEKFLTDCKINSYYIGDLDNVSGGQSSQTVVQYPKNIFVLQQGDLETYIGKVRHYKLENAIDFCKNRYDTWKTDPDNKTKIEELDKIFDQIVI
ncbi:MAG: ATP-dependent nuclease, partial [Nitrosopumilaceae archaeon]